MSDVTQTLLSDVTFLPSPRNADDPSAAEQLPSLVYDELRKLAAVLLAKEKPGQTLQATALVHEAYLRLAKTGKPTNGPPHWNSRGHFFAAAAKAMRQLLVEGARRKRGQKHGGDFRRIDLPDIEAAAPPPDLLALDEALQKFETIDPRAAKVVELHHFARLTIAQAAEVLDVAETTVARDWAYARSWLKREIEIAASGGESF